MGGLTRVRVAGPLEEFAEGFQAELVRLGYSPRTSEAQLYLMKHLSGWLAGWGLVLSVVLDDDVEVAIRH